MEGGWWKSEKRVERAWAQLSNSSSSTTTSSSGRIPTNTCRRLCPFAWSHLGLKFRANRRTDDAWRSSGVAHNTCGPAKKRRCEQGQQGGHRGCEALQIRCCADAALTTAAAERGRERVAVAQTSAHSKQRTRHRLCILSATPSGTSLEITAKRSTFCVRSIVSATLDMASSSIGQDGGAPPQLHISPPGTAYASASSTSAAPPPVKRPPHGRARSSSLVSVTRVEETHEEMIDQSTGFNANADWVNYKGAWVIHVVLILLAKILLDVIPAMQQDTSWTLVNLGYMALSYIMFHYVTGTPFESNAGVYDQLTLSPSSTASDSAFLLHRPPPARIRASRQHPPARVRPASLIEGTPQPQWRVPSRQQQQGRKKKVEPKTKTKRDPDWPAVLTTTPCLRLATSLPPIIAAAHHPRSSKTGNRETATSTTFTKRRAT
ncbi:hypothetical protein L1887_48819 [Cichorium endivia]|nr:hypothetical protein L1887_48819 [Cichorium endivia]